MSVVVTNILDKKIDAMIQQFSTNYSINYGDLRYSVDAMLGVMSRAHVIGFLKYAELQKAGA